VSLFQHPQLCHSSLMDVPKHSKILLQISSGILRHWKLYRQIGECCTNLQWGILGNGT
jgi:hypothetical protein